MGLRGIHIYRTFPLRRVHAALFVLLLASARCLESPSAAQSVCGITRTTPIRIEDATGVDILRAAVGCADGGEVEAEWAGRFQVGAPITVGEGTFLSMTGVGGLAEVHGGGSETNRTRLFEVSQGGSLALTGLKLSGGSAKAGGAIHSHGTNLTLNHCTFKGNVATDGNGGAVWAKGGNVTIVGGEFSGNHATRYGGAVLATDGRLGVRGGCRFNGNTAIGGGALFCGLSDVAPDKVPALCSITDAEFISNSAVNEDQQNIDGFSYLDGGGAAMFIFAEVDVTDSDFSSNHARFSGGAMHGGYLTNVSVMGCKFGNNTSDKYGGAISANSLNLGGGTQVTNNSAAEDGGAVFGWHAAGTILSIDALCTENTAFRNGGCFYVSGAAIFSSGTAILNNLALNGGCIYAARGSDVSITGGTYTGRSEARGGFMYVEGASRVHIAGGVIASNVSGKRGGALYVNGDEASDILIGGGTFKNNEALESGGVIAVWGATGLVTITGGTFSNNSAIFYGGFAFVEIEASISCEGAMIAGNVAGDQGGGIYAREATWVNSSCNLISNEAPQGAAIYLTEVNSATFEHHNVSNNLALGGSVVHAVRSTVIASEVTFESGVGRLEYSFNRALQLMGNTTLEADKCVFDGWLGESVIFGTNSANGSLILNSCDFSGSSAVWVVISPNSDAEIRNAIVSSLTFKNAVPGTVETPLTLVDRAVGCSNSQVCGTGYCVDSTLGVLCECLEGGDCLSDGGKLSLDLMTPPDPRTVYPDPVRFELMVSSDHAGTTDVIWELEVKANGLDLEVIPSNGVLPPGGSIAVHVHGTPIQHDAGYNLTSSFVLLTGVSANAVPTVADRLEVLSPFSYCPPFEYAKPQDDHGIDDRVVCERCATIEGQQGVNCASAGATMVSLPIRQGYWRSNVTSLVIHECFHSEACAGKTYVSNSDDYCEIGYRGPYCAVCTEGYGRRLSNTCQSCHGPTDMLLIVACTLFALMATLLTYLAVVFLIAGPGAVNVVVQTMIRGFTTVHKAARHWDPMPEIDSMKQITTNDGYTSDSMDRNIVPTTRYTLEVDRDGGEVGSGHRGSSSRTRSERRRPMAKNAQAQGAVVGAVIGGMPSPVTTKYVSCDRENALHAGRHTAQDHAHDVGNIGAAAAGDGGTSMGRKGNWPLQRLPMDKFKILLGVWQILTVFSSITGVVFPDIYSVFLSWVNIFNLDLGYILSASCILPPLNFYQQLLATTITPVVIAAGLVVTYHLSKLQAGIGSAGVRAKQAAWSRHVTAGLLLTFLVFTSASSAVLKTFACDNNVVEGESYLRADYSLSCGTHTHKLYSIYAGLMILVYPIGIPVLYFLILWTKRELLNPRIYSAGEKGGRSARARDDTTRTDVGEGNDIASVIVLTASNGQAKAYWSRQELQELDEKMKARTKHPELVPLIFLWRDFGSNLYYYEVVECGRRILLTEVLIFIAPHSAIQAAMACIFAFVSLLAFELLRPHVDPVDSWLYRLGCVVIFLSYFLALMIKLDVAEDPLLETLGICLVIVNVVLAVAVVWFSWFAIRQIISDSDHEESASA